MGEYSNFAGCVLVLFEVMSNLKVNFNKSMLVGVNIVDSWLGKAATILGCKVDKVSFLYLGLPIGDEPRRLMFWEPVQIKIALNLDCLVGRVAFFLLVVV